MQVGHALCLVTETLVRDNEHLGNGQTMQVLVVNRLKTGDFLQRLVRLKRHIVGHSRRRHEEVAARTGIVGVVCSTDLHGVLGIVDAPYHHIARGIGQQVALVALGHGKAHVQLVAILLADVIVVLVGQDKVVQTGHQHVGTGRAESQHRLKLAMLGGVTELERGIGAGVVIFHIVARRLIDARRRDGIGRGIAATLTMQHAGHVAHATAHVGSDDGVDHDGAVGQVRHIVIDEYLGSRELLTQQFLTRAADRRQLLLVEEVAQAGGRVHIVGHGHGAALRRLEVARVVLGQEVVAHQRVGVELAGIVRRARVVTQGHAHRAVGIEADLAVGNAQDGHLAQVIDVVA